MKIIFSRKGFDSSAGGVPSPIVNHVPISLPIPGGFGEPQRYRDLQHPLAGNLAPHVTTLTNGRIGANFPAHADPVLPDGWGPAALGQTGAAQAHLENQGVGSGDVFVFFGLFRNRTAPKGHPDARPHHRIFGMMTVTQLCRLGANPDIDPSNPYLAAWRDHPHVVRRGQADNNTLWIGNGCLARAATPALRLTDPDATGVSKWRIPPWLKTTGLSYHDNPNRWSNNHLHLVARGQEFVADISTTPDAREWLANLEHELLQPTPACDAG